jgi:hypothetical protein
MALVTRTNQAAAQAGGDVVGNNKTTNITAFNFGSAAASSKIHALKMRLLEEVKADKVAQDLIEGFQIYHNRRRAPDGIEGLEQKLRAGCREHEIMDALEQKEMFAKLLARWSMYVSAQEIFVHLLSLAVHEFRMSIQPLLGSLDISSYNEIVSIKIVRPMMEEVGEGTLSMDALVTMGMYYWLAEQCFVRWHA